MKLSNRFIESAKVYDDYDIPIDQIFLEATDADAHSVIDAMYVIAERRARSGRPLSINEIASGVPILEHNRSVLDAAVEICIDGYLSQGYTHADASEILMNTTSLVSSAESISESVEVTDSIKQAVFNNTMNNRRLPCFFGNKEVESGLRYELRKLLGSGSQGAMYEAIDRCFAEDGQPSLVAIKIAHDTEDKDRSRLEATRARRVRHKNIAQVHDCGVTASSESYIAYELIEGLTLDKWIINRSKPLTPVEACKLVIQLADGVQSAHNNGVVHRDIKPSNILMNRDGDPVLTDFGIAYSATNDLRLSSYYGTRGSLAFMAPEQYQRGADGTAPSVDVYSLGGILYWLITGQYPNGATISDATTRLEMGNIGGTERDLQRVQNSQLVRIIEKSLAADLSQRYTSPAQFGADLAAYISNRPVGWLDSSWLTCTQLFVRRNPLVVLLYFATTAALVTSVAVWLSGQSKVKLAQSQSAATLRLQQFEALAALEQEKLNSRVVLEQDRVRQLSERNIMAKNMLVAWSQAADNKGDEVLASANLLFLYTISTCGFLDDDPLMADKILNQRVETAEAYLETLTLENSSPIQRAQWHEMLAAWYVEQGNEIYLDHLNKAEQLVSEYAAQDKIWMDRLKELMVKSSSYTILDE